MNPEEIRKLFSTGNYIWYGNSKYEKINEWHKGTLQSPWQFDTLNYRLIHKKHKEVADRVSSDSTTKVMQKTNPHQGWIEDNDFFANYQEWHEYKLEIVTTDTINIIAIATEDGEIYEFENINNLKRLEYLSSCYDGHIVKVTTENSYSTAIIYNNDWTIVNVPQNFTDYKQGIFKLIPIKKPWYENPDNFPVIVINEEGIFDLLQRSSLKCSVKDITDYLDTGWRPATKEELLTLSLGE